MHDAKMKARATYNAAADSFDDPALSFWERFGQATIDRLDLALGATVLDVCAGSGASAIPAAIQVGPSGRVVAIDLAENLLALAAKKARGLGLSNFEIRSVDVDALDYASETFDAVVCVFGIFFLPDIVGATSRLWRMVKPDGRLAITTWGPRLWEPASSLFWDAVDEIRPDLTRAYNPWDSLSDPNAVRSLLLNAGASDIRIESLEGLHALRAPDDFWTIVLGSGYRATYESMTSGQQRALRSRVTESVSSRHVLNVETNVIFATATKV